MTLLLGVPLSLGRASESEAQRREPAPEQPAALAEVHRLDPVSRAQADLGRVNFEAFRRAVRDLAGTFPDRFQNASALLRWADDAERRRPALEQALARGETNAIAEAQRLSAAHRQALLANPLLDFDRLLVILRRPLGDARRGFDADKGIAKYIGLPQQSSWQIHTMPNVTGWTNEIALLSDLRGEGRLETIFAAPQTRLISDLDLHYDAERLLFSMPDSHKLWQVFEMGLDGRNLRQLSPANQPEVHNFDAAYLPNDKIVFLSTATFQGVPCNAGVTVAMTYSMEANGQNIRQLCFEQDHNYCPTVMNDGRILYLRWEYTDIPHVWARILFTMNPDGTGQREFYGSGSYWPNSVFFSRPIPNHPSKIVGIVTGHHVGRIGELVVFDPAVGRHEADGAVQRIPGAGRRIEPLIQDKLTRDSWPKFTYPFPLSDKYFLVTCKPTPDDLWGLYLVDVFDNVVRVKEVEDQALVGPIPVMKRPRPPVIQERTQPERQDALMYVEDVYQGPGLQGVPRGTVKTLRLFTYHFAYQRVAGIDHRVGADGPWEPKRVLGTVRVEADGSAFFRVPAHTPISIQPLDATGKAVQLMRSWATAMPGEIVSCTGCHEHQNGSTPNRQTIAALTRPQELTPWRGPVRGFSFARDVQPVLDRHCVRCHDGTLRPDGQTIPDLRRDQNRFICFKGGDPVPKTITGVPKEKLFKDYGGVFEPAYIELRRLTRVGGLESDLHVLDPGEFHADTTELFQMLRKGHHGVVLGPNDWDRLTTWVDLNAPCHGTWRETVGIEKVRNNHQRRAELAKLYAEISGDPEEVPAAADDPADEPEPASEPKNAPVETTPKAAPAKFECPGWPFDAAEAKRRQTAAGQTRHTLELGSGVTLELVLIPAGEFLMGDAAGAQDEQPVTRVRIDQPFWMARFEISNEQYGQFDPHHDSRFEDRGSWIFSEEYLGWKLNHPRQPVVRVSWREAMDFCRWLSAKTGLPFTLPTEAQWEYACRAGTETPFSYGGLQADFSRFANLADYSIRELAYDNWSPRPPDLVPREARCNDGALVTADVGSYAPNAWGLHDMHGNAWEWTRTTYAPFPYHEADGRNAPEDSGRKVARGGSWYDRPPRARSSFRLDYPSWQRVSNVGFRVITPVITAPVTVQARPRTAPPQALIAGTPGN